jgi:Domain of unknown function DUF488
MSARSDTSPVILTIGHSTRTAKTFLEMLRAHGVERIVDVRTIPRSRRNPQFNSEELAAALRRAGIGYTHLKALGGLRHARADSRNLAWRNASFRGFADYMQTPEFEQGIARLLELAAKSRCAIMCAEAVPWRCHRSLIADALTARGIAVEHILSRLRRERHRMTPFAKVRGKRVTYPGAASEETHSGRSGREREGELKLEYGAAMAGKKKTRKFTAGKEARRRAREAAGAPPAERVIPDKRRKPAKHKKRPEEEEE